MSQKWLLAGLALLAITVQQAQYSNGAKILGFFSAVGPSHLIIHTSLMNALAKRGHEITTVSALPFPAGTDKSIRQITLDVGASRFQEQIKAMLKTAETTGWDWSVMIKFTQDTTQMFEEMLVHPDFVQIKNETFDLLFLGWFMNDFHIGLAAHFKVPTIVALNVKPTVFARNYVGMPHGISYNPSEFVSYKGVMSFRQRLHNFFLVSADMLFTYGMNYFWHEPHYAKHFPSDKYVSFHEARKNISLVLANHHFSQGSMEAYLPNMVEVGGMHIKAEPNPLPKDIQDFIDGATEGAIFFSLGSNVKSSNLSPGKRDAILRSLGKMKQRVLWKWEDDQMPNQPDNVMISKWFPQSDILAHPNTKLFISHCGQGSVNEAKFHGVPMLGIPIFADQPANLATIEKNGWAVGCPLNVLNEELLTAALNEVLYNKTYYNTVKKISNLYRDRPQHPLDTAVYWVEYVIRHNGAKHMQSPAVHLNFFQYNSLDVIGFIVLCIYVVVKIIKFAVCAVVRKCRSKSKTKRE